MYDSRLILLLTKLAQHSSDIEDFPFLSNFSVGDATDNHPSQADLPVSRRKAHELPDMTAAESEPPRHLLSFGDLILNRPIAIRECGQHGGLEALVRLKVKLPDGRFVLYIVDRQQLIHHGHIVVGETVFKIAPDYGLVFVWHRKVS